MKKNIILFISIIVLLGVVYIFAQSKEGSDTAQQIKNGESLQIDTMQPQNFSAVDPATFKKLYETGEYIAIDVRTPEEIAEGKAIGDALEINYYDNDFREQLNALDKSKKYLVYCRSGARSGQTARIMKELGFTQVYDLDGGINAWNALGYTTL